MDKLQKISDTQFSRPVPDEVVDISVIQMQKDATLRRIEQLQAEIDGYDVILNQAKDIGLKVEDAIIQEVITLKV